MFIINKLFALVCEGGVMEGWWSAGAASTPCLCYVIRSEPHWSIVNMIFHKWTRPWGQNRGQLGGIYIKWNCILLVSSSIVVLFNFVSFRANNTNNNYLPFWEGSLKIRIKYAQYISSARHMVSLFFFSWRYNPHRGLYEGWNFNGGNYLFTNDTK